MSNLLTNFLSYGARLDDVILYAIQSIGPRWEIVANFLSHGVGSYPLMIAILVVGLFLIEKRRVAMEIIVIAVISFVVVSVAKDYFDAPRPYMVDPSVIAYDTENSPGLPSRHAVMSLVVLGWLILKHPKSHVITPGGTVIIILVGLSRIYLGVHYPSQVLAGWLFGALLLYIFYLIDKRLWSPFKKEIRKR